MDQIIKISISDPVQAAQVLSVQREAYQVEADLIGFREIPPLLESLDELMQSAEIFLGYETPGKLLGFIALETDTPRAMTISRLCVSPAAFRQGIASRLLSSVFSGFPEVHTFQVTTGAGNVPAIAFYTRAGFRSAGFQWVADGRLQIARFIYSR